MITIIALPGLVIKTAPTSGGHLKNCLMFMQNRYYDSTLYQCFEQVSLEVGHTCDFLSEKKDTCNFTVAL